jgi:preprotein translocase subunit SecG
MAILYPFLVVVHILICVGLIIVVLLQSSKGEGLAGAFGGGGLSGAVFGGRGAATFLSKATSFLAVGFMVTSIALTLLSFGVRGPGASGVIENLKTGPTEIIPPPASSVPGEAPVGTDTGSAGGIFQQGQQPQQQPDTTR